MLQRILNRARQLALRRYQRGFIMLPGGDSATSSLTCDAVDFRANAVARGAGLTGAVDGKKGIISVWFRQDGLSTSPSAGQSVVFTNDDGTNILYKTDGAGDQFALQLSDSSGAAKLILVSATGYPSGSGTWRHLLLSWNLAVSGARHLYVNDVSDISVNTFVNGTIDYTSVNWSIGAFTDATYRWRGEFAELYVNFNDYLDFSDTTNRRKFITASGLPVSLGSDGSLPTGNPPIVYMSLTDGGAKSTFLTNKGTGGNFTETSGTIRVAVGNPSDATTRMDAADFDGTNDYMKRGAGLTGAADSKLMTFVCWFRLDGSDATALRLFSSSSTLAGTGDRLRINRSSANQINVIATNAAGATILSVASTATYTAGATWRCLMFSCDLSDVAKRFLYVGDTSDLGAITTYTNDTMDFTVADWSVGANPDGTSKFDGALADLHFYPGVYVDFSSQANRRKFFLATGKAADTGSNGIIPTASIPIALFRLFSGDSAANFGANLGSGGDFTITGSLDTASTSPTT